MRGIQTTRQPAFALVRVVARGGAEPPTFRFSVPRSPSRSRTTWHLACRSYLVEAPEAPRALELLDSPLDSQPNDRRQADPIPAGRCTGLQLPLQVMGHRLGQAELMDHRRVRVSPPRSSFAQFHFPPDVILSKGRPRRKHSNAATISSACPKRPSGNTTAPNRTSLPSISSANLGLHRRRHFGIKDTQHVVGNPSVADSRSNHILSNNPMLRQLPKEIPRSRLTHAEPFLREAHSQNRIPN